jgi:metal-dependent HD superfamily phosphatase/phosphodiesterase
LEKKISIKKAILLKMKEIEEELRKIAKGPKLKKLVNLLIKDKEIDAFLEQANNLSILRLGYNDHGKTHAEISALNALKIFEILSKKGIKPNIVSEKVGNEEDSKVAIVLGAYLHDIGCSVCREGHDLVGAVIAYPIIQRILKKFYNQEKLDKISCFVLESIICHMGYQDATSFEARLVEVADSTDVTKWRARIPFSIGKADIHKFSALAIEEVNFKEGEKKPLRIEVVMENPAGIFQTEETMLKRIKHARFDEIIEVVAKIKGEEEIRYL